MKIKHQDIEIAPSMPFAKCKLGRAKYADVLTNIVSTYADGFVLAINNEWGAGKTTFVKMWQQDLIRYEFQTIYFNAWENDFDSNALVAIMSELKALVNDGNKKAFKTVLQKGAILAKHAIPALVKAAASKHLDLQILSEVLEATAKGATEVFEKEIEEFASKKKTILEFREALEKYIEKSGRGEKTREGETAIKQKPIVFFIDELDRCRPSYSVEVLEQLKHLFSVPGIVFVLSIDKEQLANAVRGYYGSDKINGDEYLRRFIDLEYAIPKPSNKDFCTYLFDYYDFEAFFKSSEVKRKSSFEAFHKDLLDMSVDLFEISHASLRQQERIWGLTRLVLLSFGHNNYEHPLVLFFLTFLKIMKAESFRRLEEKILTLEELKDLFFKLMNTNPVLIKEDRKVYAMALLLFFYNNDRGIYKKDLGTIDEIEHVFGKFPPFSRKVHQNIRSIIETPELNGFELSTLINKINLTDPFKSHRA